MNKFFFSWRVLIKSPEETPYEGKWWYLYVYFDEQYPLIPPNIRFVTVPYHLNVSPEGRICSNILEKGYFSSIHIVDILTEIKELFLLPNPDLPVRIDVYDVFRNDKDEYFRLARESTLNNALDDYSQYINPILSNVPPDFQIEPHDFPPPHLVSQISNQRIKNNKMILASSGVYYDRYELKRFVSLYENPRCIITGKQLTKKIENIDDPTDYDDYI